MKTRTARRRKSLPIFLTSLLVACSGGGNGGVGGGNPVKIAPPVAPAPEPVFEVAVKADSALPENFCSAPLFAPADLAEPILARSVDLDQHRGKTGFVGDTASLFAFPRHLVDGGPSLELDSGVKLTDDIRFIVGSNSDGQFVSVQFKGQPLIGPDSLSHESEVVTFDQSVTPLESQEFTIHVDTMQPIPVWELEGHLGGDRTVVVGMFCVEDLVFTPAL